jgi:hypothetical protein
MGPAPRFAGATLWLLGTGSMVLLIGSWDNIRGGLRLVGILVLALGLVVLAVRMNGLSSLVVSPGEDGGFHVTEEVPVTSIEVDSGLVLHVAGLCGKAALPCTPEPSPGLRLGRDGDLGSGFFLVSGEWVGSCGMGGRVP